MVLDRRGYFITMWSGLGLILIGLAIVALGYFGSLEDKQIDADGIETSAAIVGKGLDTVRNEQRYFWNIVFFDLRSERHQAKRSVNKGLWESSKVGNMVSVKYLPSDPASVRLTSEIADPNELFYWLGAIGGVIALAGFGFTLYARMERPGPVRVPREFSRK